MWEQHVLIYSLGVVSVWRTLIRNWHSRDDYLALPISLSKSVSGGLLLNLRDRSNFSLVKWVVFETSDCLDIGYSSCCTSMNEAWEYGRVNGLTAPVKPLSSRVPSGLSPSWSILPSDKPQHWLVLSSEHNSVYLRMSSSATAPRKGLGQEWKCLSYKISLYEFFGTRLLKNTCTFWEIGLISAGFVINHWYNPIYN